MSCPRCRLYLAGLTQDEHNAAMHPAPRPGAYVCSWLSVDGIKVAREAQELYGPDGRAMDGPRTTAAELARELVDVRRSSHGPAEWIYCGEYLASSMTWDLFRGAAFIEGDLYSEAIRGARALRLRMLYNAPRSVVPMGRPDLELNAGSPIGWAQRD